MDVTSWPKRRKTPGLILLLVGAGFVATAGCHSGPSRLGPRPGRGSGPESIPPVAETATELPRRAEAPGPGSSASPLPRGNFRSELGDAQRAEAHLDLAEAFRTKGDYDEAISQYRQAIEASRGRRGTETRARSHRRLASALERKGHFREAEQHHNTAIELAPDNPRAWNDSGYAAYLRGDWGLAVERLTRASELAPDDSRVSTNLGLALAGAGRMDEAFEALSRAGGHASAHANLGYILAALGRAEEARGHYVAALRLSPDLAPARRALTRLDLREAPDSSGTALADGKDEAPRDDVIRTSAERAPEGRGAQSDLPPLP